MPVPGRHSWSDKTLYRNKSERVCKVCGLVKVVRHEGQEHWVEYWREERRLASGATPPCPGAKETDVP